MNTVLLTFQIAIERCGIKKSKAYNWIQAGTFPIPVRLGNRSMFVESEIEEWIQSKLGNRGVRKLHDMQLGAGSHPAGSHQAGKIVTLGDSK